MHVRVRMCVCVCVCVCKLNCQEFVSLLEGLIVEVCNTYIAFHVINQLCTGIMGRYEAKKGRYWIKEFFIYHAECV